MNLQVPVLGWTTTTLGVLGRWGSGGTPSRSNSEYYGGEIPWLVIGDLNESVVTRAQTCITASGLENSSAKLVPPGSLLVAMYGSIGKTAITGVSCTTNQAIAHCIPHAEISLGYLHRAIQWLKPALIAQGQGGTQQNISQGILKEQAVPLAPEREQERIANKLDAVLTRVDAVNARLDRVAPILKRFRQSVLAAATTGRLTESWRSTGPQTGDAKEELDAAWSVRAQTDRKPASAPDLTHWNMALPSNWTVASVHQFAECLDRLRVPIKKDDRKSAKGLYPYYGANGEVGRIDEFIFDDELVLVTEDETFYGREKPIAYRVSGRCWVNNHAHVLRAPYKEANDYLCYALMHYNVIPWLSGTTGRAKLTQAALNALPIGLPPKRELIEIVRRVKILFAFADRLEARLRTVQTATERLTPSLLDKAFRGELVPQDPNDEPASELLRRLLASALSSKISRSRVGLA